MSKNVKFVTNKANWAAQLWRGSIARSALDSVSSPDDPDEDVGVYTQVSTGARGKLVRRFAASAAKESRTGVLTRKLR